MTVDLSACDREPVQFSEAIQPHGVLLAVEEAGWRIRAASGNAHRLTGGVTEFLGRPLADVLPEQAVWLDGRIRELDPAAAPVHLGAIASSGGGYEVFAHRCDDLLVLEFETIPEGNPSGAALYAQVRACIAKLRSTRDLAGVLDVAVRAIRDITGYDRVLAYKFLADGTGHILAEARRDDLSSFLGLHFPPGDVPAPARRVLSLVWVRYQPDIAYAPVPLLSDTGRPLDLSYSALRSTSAMCNRYYLNLGVRSKLVLALLSEGEMWGAVICQHETAKHVPQEVRMACETVGHTVSMVLIEREKADLARDEAETHKSVGMLLGSLFRQTGGSESPEGLLACIPAGGAALAGRGTIAAAGDTPPVEEIRSLVDWLENREPAAEEVYSTNCLPARFPRAATYANQASGLLAIRLAAGDYALWFRPETAYEVSWAGDPQKPVEVDERSGQLRLAPRTDFVMRRAPLRGLAEPWKHSEREAAAALRMAIITSRRIGELQSGQETMMAANSELEAFTYTAAHDLREPLRGIATASQLLERSLGEIGEPEKKRLTMIRRLAIRMDNLLQSLLECSRVGTMALQPAVTDMNALAAEAAGSIDERLLANGVSIRISPGLPAVECDAGQIQELLTNLIVNGIKYNESPRKVIEIGYRHGPEVAFYVRDNGIGIAPEHQAAVFALFRRLHDRDAYGGGSGAGLAIVRKIVERHRGKIWIESREGAGSTFFFTLPTTAPQAAEAAGK